jgi:hypothetical protein
MEKTMSKNPKAGAAGVTRIKFEGRGELLAYLQGVGSNKKKKK